MSDGRVKVTGKPSKYFSLKALSLQFSGISIPAYVISIPCTPGAKNSFK